MQIFSILKEGRRRKLTGIWDKVVGGLAIAFILTEIYGAPFGFIDSFVLRGIFVSCSLALTFLCYTATGAAKNDKIPWYDLLFSALSLFVGLHLILHGGEIVTRWTGVDPLLPMDWFITSALVLLTLEVTRRTVGLALFIIILLFVSYNFIGKYLPGYFGHRGITLEVFLDRMAYTYDGILGTPVGVACTYVVMFVMFGQVFNAAGGGNFFFRLATAIAGNMRGGPAKICVIASGLYGTLSGSPVSDVVTTGSITIPLMQRLGYGSTFSGAVAAASCSGASIMPPIMGTAAFLMVDIAGIPYLNIALAAAIPAAIFYFGIMVQVDYRAALHGMRPLSEGEGACKEGPLKVLKDCWLYLIPIAVLLWLIVIRISPTVVGLAATLATVIISWFIPGQRLGPRQIYLVFRKTALGLLTVANASAAAGLVIGAIMLTGLGGKFTSLVFAATGGQSGLCLAMVALVCIILGMGMPVPAAYVLTATLAVPALLEFNFSLMGSHLFIVYFSAISAITPPVAVAAYAAAGISEGNPNSTGVQAVKLAIAAYLVPFIFMYRPGLILDGGVLDIVWTTLMALVAVFSFAAGFEGYLRGKLESRLMRMALLLAGISFIWPSMFSDFVGMGVFLLIFMFQYRKYPATGAKTTVCT
ncbi:TRAP transporter fused permease subunit [Desulfovibrio sp. OttesenSCG-928-C14]|nr:TRAP transporter fused permease subunit [Desulfovibrio sp. OttesenSCG-928-C14]